MRVEPEERLDIALCGLALAALALRLWQLQALGGFDWDEVATVYIAARPLPDLLTYLQHAPFEHPPVYYLLAHAWMALGSDEVVLRMLSALLGALTVPLVGRLGAELFGPRAGLAAATLLAVAPAHVFYSRDARMYSLLTLLSTLALYGLVRGLRSGQAGWWILWGGASVAALGTHYFAAFPLAGQVLYLLCVQRGGRLGRAALGGTLIAAGAALAGWWALSPGLRQSLAGLRLAPLAADEVPLSLWRATAGLLRGPFAEEPPLVDEASGALALTLLGVAAIAAWQRSRRGARLLLAAGLAPALGLAALVLIGRDLNVRYLLCLLPLALLALAAGWGALWPSRRGTVALVATWTVLGLQWFVPYYRDYVRGDYALALRQIEAAEQPGEAVVFNGPWQTLLFQHYYRGGLPAHILTGAVPLVEGQVATALADLASRYQALWLLETDMGHADPTEFVPRWLARYGYRHLVEPYRQVRLGHYLVGGAPLRVQRVGHVAPGVRLAELGLEPDGLQPGRTGRVELVWRVEEEFDRGLKASLRLRDGSGHYWWATDPWLTESWLAPRPPRVGDLLHTRVAIPLPAEAPAAAYALEIVVYRSTEQPASGEGWVAWSAPPLLLHLDSVASGELSASLLARPQQ